MDWLTEFLKQLSNPRALIVALFVTTFVLFVGERYAPYVVPSVPTDWAPVLFGCMVFSGCLSFFWGVASLWWVAKGATQKVLKILNNNHLTPQEMELLSVMGGRPNVQIFLEKIDYRDMPFTHLELSALMLSMQAKGLVNSNEWNGEAFILTEQGRARALKLHQENTKKNAS